MSLIVSTVFLACFVILIVTQFRLIRRLQVISQASSRESGADLFGARYRNVYHLFADLGFWNSLWASTSFDTYEPPLKEALQDARLYLRILVFGSSALFFAAIGVLASEV